MHRGLLLGAILMVTAIWWFANPPVAALSDRGNAAFDSGFATPAPVTGTLSQPVDRELAAPVPNDAERGVASRFAAESDTTNHRPRAVTPEPPSPELRRLRVLDPLGRPIIGAELSVGMVFDSDGRRRGDGPVAITDAFGRARMMLAAGTYVQACAAGFVLSGEKIEAGNEEVEIVLTGSRLPSSAPRSSPACTREWSCRRPARRLPSTNPNTHGPPDAPSMVQSRAGPGNPIKMAKSVTGRTGMSA